MNYKSISIVFLLLLFLSGCDSSTQEEHHEPNEHGNHESESSGHENEESGTVHFTAEQLKTANIIVTELKKQPVTIMLFAPGEVKLNAYTTVKITPRIAAQVIDRRARLGDVVIKGQPLLTLSSVEMARAQGEYRVTYIEWKRVKKLGRNVVSGRRYTEARVKFEQSKAKILAYGMNEKQIKKLIRVKNPIASDGTFQLTAPQAGRILHDNFIVGERIDAGREIMTISDESVLWVDARITPDEAGKIKIGNNAIVLYKDKSIEAKVSQINHTLDKITRTLSIRLEVVNEDDRLHPGMFVNTRIATRETQSALTIPEAAVLRSADGDWQIMVEQDEVGEFKPVEIEVKSINEGNAIIEGIKPGSRVVTQGAFFVQSELAKGGFEIHNH